MKNVLIIANLFHASPRIPGIATYLSDCGWRAHIMTPPLGIDSMDRIGVPRGFGKNVEIISAPFKGDIFEVWRKLFRIFSRRRNGSVTESIKESLGVQGTKSFIDRLVRLYHMIFAYPDTEKAWIAPTIALARRLLRQKSFDAIVSSSPFPTNHIIAHELKKEFSIPWCAEFRDPWTQNHTYDFPAIRRVPEEKLEKKILASADKIVAAAPSYAQKQSQFLGREVRVITNGFDPDLYESETSPLDECFSIAYTGTIYPEKQNPVPFLDALQSLMREQRIDISKAKVTFYGNKQEWLSREIEKRDLQKWVKTVNALPRREVVRIQRSSQLLLVLGWEDAKEQGIYPSKIFEYLGAHRPILIVGGNQQEEIKTLVKALHAGVSAQSAEEIKNAILAFYADYTKNGSVRYDGNGEAIKQYSFPQLAKQYSTVLDHLVKK